jgi:hypothetical protein
MRFRRRGMRPSAIMCFTVTRCRPRYSAVSLMVAQRRPALLVVNGKGPHGGVGVADAGRFPFRYRMLPGTSYRQGKARVACCTTVKPEKYRANTAAVTVISRPVPIWGTRRSLSLGLLDWRMAASTTSRHSQSTARSRHHGRTPRHG